MRDVRSLSGVSMRRSSLAEASDHLSMTLIHFWLALDTTQQTRILPLVLVFENPKAIESWKRSRSTTTIAKKQSHFKVDAIADENIFGQRSVEDCEMYARKLKKETENERSKQAGVFTLVIFFGIGSECRI